jgi:hypothetical protein
MLSTTSLAHADSFVAVVATDQTSGNLGAGDTMRVFFGMQPANVNDDVAVDGACTVNGKDVSTTFTDATGGTFYVDYSVAAGDTARAPGTVPFSCSLRDVQTSETAVISSFTDGNQVSVNWTDNGGGTGTGTGTTTATTTVDKTTLASTIATAQTLHDNSVEGTNPGQYAVGSRAIFQSAIDAAHAAWNDANATQSEIVTANTNLNTAIDTFNQGKVPSSTGGGSGGTGSTIPFTGVTIEPDHSMRTAGFTFLVNLQAPSFDSDMSVDGTCTVNGKDVSSSLTNMTDGLYNLTYVVGPNDANAPAGQIPISCTLSSPSSHDVVTATHFTDNDSAGINVGEITNIQAVSNGATSEIITFNTATPTSADIEYTINGTTLATQPDTMTTSHSITIPSLAASSTYDYEVVATDSNNIEFTSAERLTFTTGANGSGTGSGTGTTTATSTGTGTGTGNNNGTGTSTATSTLTGSVDNGNLQLVSIVPVSTVASADGTFAHGWKWIFNATLPYEENHLSMRFDNWTDGNGHTIPVTGNMRISSTEAASMSPVMINAANTYSDPLVLTGDRDNGTVGRQVQITVEMSIPTGSNDGSYNTTYGIQSNP